MDYLEIVNELNRELYDKHGETDEKFFYTLYGYVDVIGFGSLELWNSEDSERKWIEEENDYEPFVPFIKRMLKKTW